MHANTTAQSLVPKSLKDEAEEVVKICGYREKRHKSVEFGLKKKKQGTTTTKRKSNKKQKKRGKRFANPKKGRKTDRTEGIMT